MFNLVGVVCSLHILLGFDYGYKVIVNTLIYQIII
nr:MAG TPA: hypothetical protein [Caudoviricetes sp.]